MNPWNQYTLFRLLLFFTFGIILQTANLVEISISWWIMGVAAVLLVLAQFAVARYKLYAYRWVTGLLLSVFMLVFGFEWSRFYDQRNHPQHLLHVYDGTQPVFVQLIGPVEVRPNSLKVLAKAIALETDSDWIKTKGKILLYFPKDTDAEPIRYGDRLLVLGKLLEPMPPSNPNEFDYKRFLANKNIHFQAFLRQDQWIITGRGYGNPVVEFAHQMRENFISIFERHGVLGRDFAVATALILGMNDYLDNDTRKEFSAAGAMHVLCVSGLHVGVIFLVLSSILSFLNRGRYSRLFRSLLLLAGIWFYALLTGLSPSVLRASSMFSFVIIGMTLNRKSNIYNSLSASAFVLLLSNPFLIREVGFQLSYSAVVAIVAIQPKLYQLWKPRYWLPDKMWALVTVSVAAQIGTAPLGLYYFHQFPNYFIITNLMVIPLASAILYTGFLTAIFSFVPIISGWISWLLVISLKALNYSVSFVDSLPYSATTGIFISFIEMMIIFFIIMALFRSLVSRNTLFLKITLSCLIIIIALSGMRQYVRSQQQRIVVYSLRNHVAVDLIHRNTGIMLVDSALLASPAMLDFQVSGHHVRSGVKQHQMIAFNNLFEGESYIPSDFPIKASYPFIQFGNRIILVVDRETPALDTETLMKADLMVVVDRHRNPQSILSSFQANNIVLSNKVPPWNLNQWLEASSDLDIPCHVIREHGAFVWNTRSDQK